MEELKPCPFCGGKAVTHSNYGTNVARLWVVGCDGNYGNLCPGYVWKMTPVYYTKESAVKAWNRRTTEGGANNGYSTV